MITKTGSKPFSISYKTGQKHTYNTFLLSGNKILYKYNGVVYKMDIK